MQNCKCVDRSCRKITHVIFDLDGTLVNSEEIYRRAYKVVLGSFGKEFTPELAVQVLGRTEKIGCEILTRECELIITSEEFAKLFRAESTKYLPTVELMPGAHKIVKHLYDNHVPLAIATSSTNEAMQLKMTKHQELLKYFHHYVCGGTDPEVKNSKPAPDIFLICASRFTEKPNPRNVLVVEDAPNGLMGALAAKMNVILVPAPETDPNMYSQAPHVYKSLEDVQLELFDLPPLK